MTLTRAQKTFGLSPCIIQNMDTKAWAYFTGIATLTITDQTEIVKGMNSIGSTTEQFSGSHTCEGSLSVNDFSAIHLAILSGYAITDDVASAANAIESVHNVAGTTWGDEMANIVLANNAKPGRYHVKETNAGVEQVQIAGFSPDNDPSVAIMAAAPAGVANDDEAIITILPPTAMQGTLQARAGTIRPAVRILGFTDAKQRTGESGGQGIEVMRARFGTLPHNLATTAEQTRELPFAAEIDENGVYYSTGLFQPV